MCYLGKWQWGWKNKARQAELNIHRASMDYEFDIDKCTGSGLIKKQTQASIFM